MVELRRMAEVLRVANFRNINELQGYLARRYGVIKELVVRGELAWVYLEAGF